MVIGQKQRNCFGLYPIRYNICWTWYDYTFSGIIMPLYLDFIPDKV